jgi:hypothetical protein
MSKNPEEKKRLFHEAFEYAEKALKSEEGEGSFGAHKWLDFTCTCNIFILPLA